MFVTVCCTPDSRCLEHCTGVAPDDQTVCAKWLETRRLVVSHTTKRVCCCLSGKGPFGCPVAICGIVVDAADCSGRISFVCDAEYSFCANAWDALDQRVNLLETWPNNVAHFEATESSLVYDILKDLSPGLLFGRLGNWHVLFVMGIPVCLDWYRADALGHQNARRRELLGPVVQLAAVWGLGLDVVRLILDLAVPRLRHQDLFF